MPIYVSIYFLAGLFELQGVSLATAILHNQGFLSTENAVQSVALAVGASLLAKIFIAWLVNRDSFVRTLTVIFLIMICGTGLVTRLTLK